jgi:hypothetical protein
VGLETNDVTITNGYCTLAEVKLELLPNLANSDHDTVLEVAINAASRAIDGHCGQRFWQDSTVVAREFYADSHTCCVIPEGISTTTGLIVKIDEDADGTFESTLTISTDFILTPRNAAAEVPVRPYTEVLAVENYSFPLPSNGRPGVQVTAKFGWPTVPDDVKKACLILSHDLFKAKDAAFGIAGEGQFGTLMIRQNKLASMLLAPYRKPSVG